MEISASNFNINEYEIQLAKFLADIEEKTNSVYEEFNKQVFIACKKNYEQIFEPITGGIRIYDYEWALDNSPFKDLFSIKKEDSLYYAMHLDDSVLLRGSEVYYYLVCYKEQRKNPTTRQLRKWKENILEFIDKVNIAILKVKNGGNILNRFLIKKYILGILDHMRSYILICFNSEMVVHNCESSNFVAYVSENGSLDNYFQKLSVCYEMFETLLFNEDYDLKLILEKLFDLVEDCRNIIECVFEKVIEKDNEILNGKCFKLHREADSFVENYVTIRYAASILKQNNGGASSNKTNIYGILSGAIEFPALFYYFCGREKYSYYYVNISGDYLQRHGYMSGETNVKENSNFIRNGILLDDNTMTGTTLEIATNYISENCDCNIKLFFLLRHPEINRIPQMKAYNKAVSVDFLKKSCIGLINHSPYSKIKYETNYYGEYLDELGVFTLTGEFFLRYLFKNGLYGKNSEVDRVGLCRQQ